MKYGIYFGCSNCIFYQEGEKSYGGWCKQGMWKTEWIGVLGEIVEKVSCVEIETEWIDNNRKGERIYDVRSTDKCDKYKFNPIFTEKYKPTFYFTVEEIAKLIEMSETTIRKYITNANIPSIYNYRDNSGRWASSYAYHTYDLYSVADGLKRINKEDKAIIIENHIQEEINKFIEYIESIS